jgi:hypothetical protein
LSGIAARQGPAILNAANLAVLDTSVYIDNLRSGRFKDEILTLPHIIRCSAVVLAELSRGARSREMKNFVEDLAKNLHVVTPTEGEWAMSGHLVNRVATVKHFDIHKTRKYTSMCSSLCRPGALVLSLSRATMRISWQFANS